MRTVMHAAGALGCRGPDLVPEKAHCQLSGCDCVRGVQVIEDVELGGAVHHEHRSNHVCQLVHLHAQAPCQRLHSHGLKLSRRAGALC